MTNEEKYEKALREVKEWLCSNKVPKKFVNIWTGINIINGVLPPEKQTNKTNFETINSEDSTMAFAVGTVTGAVIMAIMQNQASCHKHRSD